MIWYQLPCTYEPQHPFNKESSLSIKTWLTEWPTYKRAQVQKVTFFWLTTIQCIQKITHSSKVLHGSDKGQQLQTFRKGLYQIFKTFLRKIRCVFIKVKKKIQISCRVCSNFHALLEFTIQWSCRGLSFLSFNFAFKLYVWLIPSVQLMLLPYILCFWKTNRGHFV